MPSWQGSKSRIPTTRPVRPVTGRASSAGAGLARNHFPLQGLFADPIVCRSAVYALASNRCNEGPRSARPNAVQQTVPDIKKWASVRRI